MLYHKLPQVGKQASRIVLGTGGIVLGGDKELYFSLMDQAREIGINVIDSGREYADGYADECIGQWMQKRGNREEMVIISKGCHHNSWRRRVKPFDLSSDIFDTLAALQTNYLDIYFLHRDDPSIPAGEMIEALNEHWKAGRIRMFGASNWSYERIQEANAYAHQHGLQPFMAASQHFSLGVQVKDPWGGGCVSLTGPQMAPARQWHREQNFPLFAYSSLCLGLFSGRFHRNNYQQLCEQNILPQNCVDAYCTPENFDRLERLEQLAHEKNLPVALLAIAYVLNYERVGAFPTFALVGGATTQEVARYADAAEISLTDQEMRWLNLET